MILILLICAAVCVFAAIPMIAAGELVLGGAALFIGLVFLGLAVVIEISFERIHRSRPWIF